MRAGWTVRLARRFRPGPNFSPGRVRSGISRTAIAPLGIYDTDARQIGDVGLSVSDLPRGTGAVYRVEVADGRIVALGSGAAVVDAWRRARDRTQD